MIAASWPMSPEKLEGSSNHGRMASSYGNIYVYIYIYIRQHGSAVYVGMVVVVCIP